MTNSTCATNSHQNTGGANDFDFYIGRWHIENRKLVKRLTGSNEWESFVATANARKLPGGIGNHDDFIAEAWRPGFVGMSLRIFSPVTRQWTIYWLDNRTGGLEANGQLTAGVVGEFKDGIGTFICDDHFEGKPIKVRYIWSDISQHAARWEQAFSPDGGKTWETNWVMQQTRIGD